LIQRYRSISIISRMNSKCNLFIRSTQIIEVKFISTCLIGIELMIELRCPSRLFNILQIWIIYIEINIGTIVNKEGDCY
jgi:hypothetical protein